MFQPTSPTTHLGGKHVECFGGIFTSKNKNIKNIAFLLGFYFSSKGVSSLDSSLPHFPPPPHQIHRLAFFPFPEVVSFPTLLLPDTRSSAAYCLSPLLFSAKSARLLCRCLWGQHTHQALLDAHFINQKATFCFSYSLSSLRKLFLKCFSLTGSST